MPSVNELYFIMAGQLSFIQIILILFGQLSFMNKFLNEVLLLIQNGYDSMRTITVWTVIDWCKNNFAIYVPRMIDGVDLVRSSP